MIPVTRLRNGATFEHHGEPWRVSMYKHVHLSRGSGTITVKVRSLRTGRSRTFTFRSGDRVPEIVVTRKELTFLYKESEKLLFMDPVGFEQYELALSGVGDAAEYLIEGQNVAVLFLEEDVLNVEIPPKITLVIADASPGVKGDTVSGATKDAVLQTGKRIRVPLFIKKGDRVVVDTRSGVYVERA